MPLPMIAPSSQPSAWPLEALDLLLAGGAFSIVVLGVGEFFVPRKKAINYVTGGIGLSFGLAVLDYLAQSLGLYAGRTWILYLYYPLELLTGTLLFFFFTLLVEPDFEIRFPYTLLFIPALLATGLMMPYFLQSPAAKIAQLPLYATSDPFLRPVYHFIYHNLESWVIGVIAFFLIRTGLRIRRKEIRWEPVSRKVMVFALIFFGVILLYIWVNFFPSERSRKLSILVSIVMVYPLYFFQKSNPRLFLPGERAESRAAAKEGEKYKDSTKLDGLDIGKVIEALDFLMKERRIYANSSLTLSDLSLELGITPHQLSEILNSQLGMSFRQYINAYRIDLAKSILVESPGKTILDIAFDCGFGSKSPFNAAFVQATGKTPSEWRRDKGGE